MGVPSKQPAPAHVVPSSASVAAMLLGTGADSATAILVGDQRLTYAELRTEVGALASRLEREGIVAGEPVGLIAENGAFFVTAYLACLKLGACVVPLPPSFHRAALEAVVRGTAMRRMLVSTRVAADPDLAEVADACGVARLAEGATAAADGPRSSVASGGGFDQPDHLAALMFTSGSTGEPKGVMISHHNIATNTRDIVEYLGLTPEDRAMLVLPMHYCYGLSVLHTHLAAGASVVLNNAFMFPEKVLDDMTERRCTVFAGVPSTYQILLRKTRFRERVFPDLRALQQAGGKLPDALIRELRETVPNARVFVMYGQTEATARLSYLPPERLDDKLGSIGRGLPSTVLEVVDESGKTVLPGSGATGEIVATGDNVALGYWGDNEATVRTFRRGRLHTGDLATVDADGFIYIVDRARDFIKSMGTRISPRTVEDTIGEMATVVEVAVIGVPDPIRGEAIAAVVVPTQPGAASDDAVRRWCNERLPNSMVPTFVHLVTELPKNEAGKILKAELRRRYSGDVDA